MELFRERRDKTVVVRLPRIRELYHRKDIVGALKRVVGDNIDSVGQLESNLRWEVVLRDISAKQKLLSSSKLPIGDYEASLEPLYYSQRRLRITRIPMCVPNEYIACLLSDRHVNVVRMSYYVDPVDGLQTNTRIATVTTESWENVPDNLSWELDGLRGTALLFLQGRPPRCHRCSERGHKFFECPYPFCTRCRRVGHTEEEGCGPRTYAQSATVEARNEEMELQGDESEHEVQLQDDAVGGKTSTETEQATASAETVDDKEQPATSNDIVPSTDNDSSDGGGDDGDGETASEAPADDGYRQSREQRRRHRRTKKRAAASGGSANGDGSTKKRKDHESEADSDRPTKSKSVDRAAPLDPTLGRQRSFSRIPTGRRQQ